MGCILITAHDEHLDVFFQSTIEEREKFSSPITTAVVDLHEHVEGCAWRVVDPSQELGPLPLSTVTSADHLLAICCLLARASFFIISSLLA